MAKIWKKLLLVILIVACLFNVVSKIVKKVLIKRRNAKFYSIYGRTSKE